MLGGHCRSFCPFCHRGPAGEDCADVAAPSTRAARKREKNAWRRFEGVKHNRVREETES